MIIDFIYLIFFFLTIILIINTIILFIIIIIIIICNNHNYYYYYYYYIFIIINNNKLIISNTTIFHNINLNRYLLVQPHARATRMAGCTAVDIQDEPRTRLTSFPSAIGPRVECHFRFNHATRILKSEGTC